MSTYVNYERVRPKMAGVFQSLSLRVKVRNGRTHTVRTGCDGGKQTIKN